MRYHKDKQGEMVDITAPGHVEVEVSHDGKQLWINIDGVCHFRCCRSRLIQVIDHRVESEPFRIYELDQVLEAIERDKK